MESSWAIGDLFKAIQQFFNGLPESKGLLQRKAGELFTYAAVSLGVCVSLAIIAMAIGFFGLDPSSPNWPVIMLVVVLALASSGAKLCCIALAVLGGLRLHADWTNNKPVAGVPVSKPE